MMIGERSLKDKILSIKGPGPNSLLIGPGTIVISNYMYHSLMLRLGTTCSHRKITFSHSQSILPQLCRFSLSQLRTLPSFQF